MGLADNVSLEDLQIAWRGFSLPPPSLPPEPSRQEYQFLYVGTVLSVFLGLLFSFFEFFVPAVFCFLGVILCSTGVYRERERYRAAVRARHESLRAREQVLEKQRGELLRAARGCRFIGDHYHFWLNNGLASLRDKILKHIDTPPSRIAAVETSVEPDIPAVAPTTPDIHEYGAEQYSLPERVGCKFYVLTNQKLIIAPAGAVRVSSTRKGSRSAGGRGPAELADQSFTVDIGALSAESLKAHDLAATPPVDERVTCCEIPLEEVATIEYGEPTPETRGALLVATKDGKLLETPGTKTIYELLGKKL